MRIEDDIKLDFDDVLFKPKRSENVTSRASIDLTRTYNFRYGTAEYTGIPILAANMDTTGTIEMHNEFKKHGLSVAFHKHYTNDELYPIFDADYDYPVFYTTGITEKNHIKLLDFVGKYTDGYLQYLCIDVANGYQQQLVNYIQSLREMDEFENTVIMAGNVVTSDMTEALILAGADIVKVGVGPGSVCTTRIKTGVGYPQLSAIIECADAAHGLGAHVCADGGCKTSGDVAKAFGAGADFVMIGGMFAGHKESGGMLYSGSRNIDKKDADEALRAGKLLYMDYYGMSSTTAMNAHSGGVANYRASEGKRVRLPYRGPVEATIQDILGGLRSTCLYVGAKKLKELSKRTTFVRVSRTHNTVFGDDWKNQ